MPENGTNFTFKELRPLIGEGITLELVYLLAYGLILVVDEDGRSKGLPRNEAATRAYGMHVVGGDFVGNVVVVGREQIR